MHSSMQVEPPVSLYGVPLVLERVQARDLVTDLGDIVLYAAGRQVEGVSAALGALGGFFDPTAREASLRKRIEGIQPLSRAMRSPFARFPLVLEVGHDRRLPTPEGIALWGLLGNLLEDGVSDIVAFRSEHIAACATWASNVYRDSALKRLRKVAHLQRGEGAPMLPPVVGLLVLLLVNRNDAAERALPGVQNREDLEVVSQAFLAPLNAFADALKTGRRDPEHYSLYGGYLISEAKRRLGRAIVHDQDALYIDEPNTVLDFIARDLSKRNELDAERLMTAFDALVDAYRSKALGRLSRLRAAYEDVSRTARLRADLLDKYAERCGRG